MDGDSSRYILSQSFEVILPENTIVKELSFHNAKLGDFGLQALGGGLRTNGGIKSLRLYGEEEMGAATIWELSNGIVHSGLIDLVFGGCVSVSTHSPNYSPILRARHELNKAR